MLDLRVQDETRTQASGRDMSQEQQQLLSSLARLNEDADFKRFKTLYLDELLKEYIQHCIDAENPARVQGAAQVIQRIQDDIENAEEAFLKLAQQREIPLP